MASIMPLDFPSASFGNSGIDHSQLWNLYMQTRPDFPEALEQLMGTKFPVAKKTQANVGKFRRAGEI